MAASLSRIRPFVPGWLSPLPIQPLAALDAEAVAPQVVVAARRADQAPRRIGLQPTLPLSPVPDAVLGAHHPAASLAIQDRQVAHRDAEGPRLEGADAALLDQVPVTQFRFGEWIDSHAESIARERPWGRGLPL